MFILSVIIPVYNTPEAYFHACLASVLQNGLENVEIICVNDGSNAETAQMLDDAQKIHENLQVVHIGHGGVSKARNTGLAEATGKYAAFLDSDDRFCPGFLQKAIVALEDGAQLVTGRVRRVTGLQSPPPNIPDIAPINIPAPEWQAHLFSLGHPLLRNGDSYVSRAPHGRVLARELALSVPFDESLCYGEDVVWNLCLSELLPEVHVINAVVYEYLSHTTSATRRYRPLFQQELQNTMAAYRSFLARHPGSPALESACQIAAFEYFFTYLSLCAMHRSLPFRQQIKNLSHALGDPFWVQIIRDAARQPLTWKQQVFCQCCLCRLTLLSYALFTLARTQNGH